MATPSQEDAVLLREVAALQWQSLTPEARQLQSKTVAERVAAVTDSQSRTLEETKRRVVTLLKTTQTADETQLPSSQQPNQALLMAAEVREAGNPDDSAVRRANVRKLVEGLVRLQGKRLRPNPPAAIEPVAPQPEDTTRTAEVIEVEETSAAEGVMATLVPPSSVEGLSKRARKDELEELKKVVSELASMVRDVYRNNLAHQKDCDVAALKDEMQRLRQEVEENKRLSVAKNVSVADATQRLASLESQVSRLRTALQQGEQELNLAKEDITRQQRELYLQANSMELLMARHEECQRQQRDRWDEILAGIESDRKKFQEEQQMRLQSTASSLMAHIIRLRETQELMIEAINNIEAQRSQAEVVPTFNEFPPVERGHSHEHEQASPTSSLVLELSHVRAMYDAQAKTIEDLGTKMDSCLAAHNDRGGLTRPDPHERISAIQEDMGRFKNEIRSQVDLWTLSIKSDVESVLVKAKSNREAIEKQLEQYDADQAAALQRQSLWAEMLEAEALKREELAVSVERRQSTWENQLEKLAESVEKQWNKWKSDNAAREESIIWFQEEIHQKLHQLRDEVVQRLGTHDDRMVEIQVTHDSRSQGFDQKLTVVLKEQGEAKRLLLDQYMQLTVKIHDVRNTLTNLLDKERLERSEEFRTLHQHLHRMIAID